MCCCEILLPDRSTATRPQPPRGLPLQPLELMTPGRAGVLVRTMTAVGKHSVERKLRTAGARLRTLRDELVVIDEQLAHLVEDAEAKSLRALVADNPAAAIEHREAAGHSEAMAEHRRHVVAEIHLLEARQDQLLDELRLL